MHNLIDECVANFGHPPRQFSFWDRITYLRFGKPLWLWLNPSDQLKTLFQHRRELFESGRVVWGHVIQANQLMFMDGTDNCPGEVVYSLADNHQLDPEYLEQVAYDLYSLKGSHPQDPELTPIAEYLTDELIRVFGLQVPTKISPTIPCQISTTFFVRKHLPSQRLCRAVLPLVVSGKDPQVALPLPERFWPPYLIDWWVQ